MCVCGVGGVCSYAFFYSISRGPAQVRDSNTVAPTTDCDYQLSTAINRNQEVCGRKLAVS